MAVNMFSILLAALSIFIFVADGLKSSAAVSAFLFVVFAIYWLFLRRTATKWWVSRGFNKRPDANALVEWEISEEKIKSQCEGLASSESQWKLFIKVVETNDGFLFYLQKNLFYWLPFSAFEQPEEIEKVKQFVKANGVQYVLTAG